MKQSSIIEIPTNKFYRIGDVISFTLDNGEETRAIAVKQEPNGTLFCFENCFSEYYPMNSEDSNRGGYELSEMRNMLNNRVLNLFPSEILDKMNPFSNGDFLRLPTEKEIFGENCYGASENTFVERWIPMKNLRNRIALSSSGDCIEWYWLSNAIDEPSPLFTVVRANGNADYGCASNPLGVRPVFCIS